MSWLNVKGKPRVTTLPLICSLGAASNPSSSLHKPNTPVATGAVDPDAINTDGILASKGYTIWGQWNMSGLNTVQVVGKNDIQKINGYSWTCALGAKTTHVSEGICRFEFHVKEKTGGLQIGIIAAPGSSTFVPQSWNDKFCEDTAWYLSSTGDICNGDIRLVRSRKPLREGDIVGMEVDMDHGILTFRTIPADLKGNHVFGTFCPECKAAECAEWNRTTGMEQGSQDPLCPYGFIGVARAIMCYKDRVTLGNLPTGDVDEEGVWRHANGEAMKDIVAEFMANFSPKAVIKSLDFAHRTATIEIEEALALDREGRPHISTLHRILQILVHPDGPAFDVQVSSNTMGSDMRPQEQRFYLREWISRHKDEISGDVIKERWGKWLAAPKESDAHGHVCGSGEGKLVDTAEHASAGVQH